MTTTYNNSIINRSINSICCGRLTLESGVPVSTTEQFAKTTLYFTPYNGNTIGIYDGSSEWDLFDFSELSLSLSGYAANTNYDIFIYNNNGALTLESAAWTNNTTRTTSLTTQNGIYVKSGVTTRRYLGTIRTTATTGQCEYSEDRKFVWNLYNQLTSTLYTVYTVQHTYATSTWRALNNNTTIGSTRHDFVIGLENLIDFRGASLLTYGYFSAALDSTSTPGSSNIHSGATTVPISAEGSRTIYAEAGYHYIQAIQFGVSASSIFYNGIIQTLFLG